MCRRTALPSVGALAIGLPQPIGRPRRAPRRVREVSIDDPEQAAGTVRCGLGAMDDDRVTIEVVAVDLDLDLLTRIELERRRFAHDVRTVARAV
jgi:hypothetical protein